MWPFSEMSLSAATLLGTVANWVLMASLVGGVLSTFVIVKTADIKEEHWAQDRRQSSERIAALTTQGEELRKETATINARAAQAEQRAAEAKLALEQFKSPRMITGAEEPVMVSELSKVPGADVAIYIVGDGVEPSNLGRAISFILTAARWNALLWVWSGAGSATGVIVTFKAGTERQFGAQCDALVRVLNSANIASVKQAWPGDWDHFGGMLNGPPNPTAASIRIVIGAKPQ